MDPLLHNLTVASSDSEPIAKRQKLPSPTRLLCIPCSTLSDEGSYYIYIVDLSSPPSNSDGFIPLAPTLRIDSGCFDADCCCVLGSTLYMFQTSTIRARKYKRLYDSNPEVATIELSDYLTKLNVKLEKDMLSYAPPMLGSKNDPIATPTPDGRILVFSSSILIDPYDETDAQIDFELYDPRTKLWRQLPGIHDNWGKDPKRSCTSFDINVFAFLSDCTLFLLTDIGMFNLNLESPNTRGWQEQDTLAGASEIPGHMGSFSVIEDGLCFSSLCAFDIKTPNGFHVVCSLSPPKSFVAAEYETPRGIPLLGGDGECNFCLIKTALDRETLYPHMTIDVYSYDLSKYKEDKQKFGGVAKLSTSLVKSFKFLLNAYKCKYFVPLDLYPVF